MSFFTYIIAAWWHDQIHILDFSLFFCTTLQLQMIQKYRNFLLSSSWKSMIHCFLFTRSLKDSIIYVNIVCMN